MELKDYQVRALETFDKWFDALERARQDTKENLARYKDADLKMPADYHNFPKRAWVEQANSGEVANSHYVDRQDTAGRPIPHACFKVPTGGGKTLLAASVLERIQYPTGLVLWIVPSRAIYQQTKDALWNKEHPYRQRLERASGGRVKMLEKDDPFNTADIANYLCVMLIMLPAANRQRGRDFLRMFRDSGRYPSFFPDSDHALFDARMLQQYRDLDAEDGPVKQSLFNVLKILQPVVILDEAHKAYGKSSESEKRLNLARQFAESVNRLNPRLVLELSATPNRNISNLLVDITGTELKSEEMIKMPVRVASLIKSSWQDTLSTAAEELTKIDNAAISLRQKENRYIRPIAVVRVERTGRDQRRGQHVHAEDVRDYLVQNLGVPAAAIRVKSAENDELGREDLLSELSPVRWIITKAALMEGWDCPFAYLLVLLDNTRSQNALTQLVGRILRQPHARLTGIAELDRCYVFCWNLDVVKAIQQVKNGLEGEGLTGLMDDVENADAADPERQLIRIQRRVAFRERPIYMPKVLHKDGKFWRELDHLQDIVSNIDWSEIDPPIVQQPSPQAAYMQVATYDLDQLRPDYANPQILNIDKTLRISYFARRLSDLVTNPWRAAQFVMDMIDTLRVDGISDADIFDNRADYAEQLRTHLRQEIDRLSKAIYEKKLEEGLISFDLMRTEPNFALDDELQLKIADDDRTLQRLGDPVQLSLFDKVFEKQFDSQLEKDFALHLDQQTSLQWWHRVQRDYYLLGWRREKIYPDFVAFGDPQLYIFETKGEHLRNEDSQYKSNVLQLLEQYFNQKHNQVFVKKHCNMKGKFTLVYNGDFPNFVQH